MTSDRIVVLCISLLLLLTLKVLIVKGKEPTDDLIPVIAVSVLLIFLVFSVAFYLICEYIHLTINTSVVVSTLI